MKKERTEKSPAGYGAARRCGDMILDRTKGRHGCHAGINKKSLLEMKKYPVKDRKRKKPKS
ncbi:hypothetical protein AC781_00345 [Akkermansia glycaniphila]|nr:hypothetical protein AC781_10925 [Akkermansia glycaniphila]OCA04178.1 hypothetical protein AC781_00345 [Akkermansia glycaniphila]